MLRGRVHHRHLVALVVHQARGLVDQDDAAGARRAAVDRRERVTVLVLDEVQRVALVLDHVGLGHRVHGDPLVRVEVDVLVDIDVQVDIDVLVLPDLAVYEHVGLRRGAHERESSRCGGCRHPLDAHFFAPSEGWSAAKTYSPRRCAGTERRKARATCSPLAYSKRRAEFRGRAETPPTALARLATGFRVCLLGRVPPSGLCSAPCKCSGNRGLARFAGMKRRVMRSGRRHSPASAAASAMIRAARSGSR